MSTKIPLPDDVLDAVSGGVLTFEGKPVTELGYPEDGSRGLAVKTGKGWHILEYDAETRAAIQKDPSQRDKILSSLFDMKGSDKTFRIEDLFSD